MSRRVVYYGYSSGSGTTFLLDDPTITSGIAAPFALFRLKTGYTGPVVDVRRTVGATTTIVSVGLGSGSQFTLDAPVTGVVSGASIAVNLGQFVAAPAYTDPDGLGSAQDWFYTKGYNQGTGAQVWVQATGTSQPRGGTAGVMAMRNGRAEMVFDGSNDFCDFGLLGGATKPINYSVVAVGAFDGALNVFRGMFGSSNYATLNQESWGILLNRNTPAGRPQYGYGNSTTTGAASYFIALSDSVVITSGQQQLHEQYKVQGVQGHDAYVNGAFVPTSPAFGGTAVDAGGTNFKFSLGRLGEGVGFAALLGGVQFLGVWTADKAADRVGIKQKLNEMLGTTW